MEWSASFDNIELEEELANHFDSTVNKAKGDNKTIALKIYKNQEISENSLIRAYSNLRNVNHENILKFYGTLVVFRYFPSLLMEYADCGSLYGQIHHTPVQSYTTITALNWMYQCAKGLAFLHSQSIIHLNIKPQNLFLTNNFRQLKIGELGNIPGKSEMRKHLAYIAPKDKNRSKEYDAYSFGMVFYEVLSRRKPFYNMTLDLTHFSEDVSGNIASLIDCCLNHSADERPSMETVALKILFELGDVERNIKLDETLGSGAFGTVYKSQLDNFLCAVKTFKSEDKDAKKGIEREVKYLSRATHKNIIKLFGTQLSKDSKTMIVMEFADCGTLYDYIHKKGDHSDWLALRWIRQLAEGLEYLHAMRPRPIIHRDIKTSNLLLTDNYRVLKIADFGTVREQATLMSQKYVGTPEYMAPEIGLGYKYSVKSDVYCFGIVFWEVMSRKEPFYDLKNLPPLAIMNLVSQGQRPPIENTKKFPIIRSIIQNCWDTNPKKRPSMQNLVDKLGMPIHELL